MRFYLSTILSLLVITLLVYMAVIALTRPAPPEVTVARDPVSGNCYRLVFVPGNNRGAIVTTDGVLCPYGVK